MTRTKGKGKGKGAKQRKNGNPPRAFRLTPMVQPPTQEPEEEKEDGEVVEGEQGEGPSVIMGEMSLAPSVVMVGDARAVLVEQCFDAGEKAEVDELDTVMSVIGIQDLLNPPHGLRSMEYLSLERYFKPDYLL